MKLISIIFLLVFISCNQKKIYIRSNADTTKTPALFLNDNGIIGGSVVFRITKDTSYLDTINADDVKLRWKRDTAYYVPVALPLTDSLHKPLLDSLGKQKTAITYMYIPNKFLLKDFNIKL